jgi:hypothetical protein
VKCGGKTSTKIRVQKQALSLSLSLSLSRESFVTASFRNFMSFPGVVVLGEKLKGKRG